MARLLFAKGAKGEFVRRMQVHLVAAKLYTDAIDADYGSNTAAAVLAFRTANGMTPASVVDVPTWTRLTKQPVPLLRERALQVTAAFEGQGYTLAQGNFDGAGITWGIIGFTLMGGELSKILLGLEDTHPDLLRRAFGANTDQLLSVLGSSQSAQLSFANGLSLGASKERLAEPWRSAFATLGTFPVVQQVQLDRVVDAYYKPARRTAASLGLETELGVALAFDIHVQNGGIQSKAAAEIAAQRAAHPIQAERDLRIIVARAVADASNPRFRQDVLSRKLTFATGTGVVHGASYVVRNWGLDELPAG